MKILRNIKIIICVKSRLPSKLAFTVLVVSTLVPHGIAAIKVIPDIVRDISDNKLGFRYVIPLVILEIIIE